MFFIPLFYVFVFVFPFPFSFWFYIFFVVCKLSEKQESANYGLRKKRDRKCE